jgi:hypothetical protein
MTGWLAQRGRKGETELSRKECAVSKECHVLPLVEEAVKVARHYERRGRIIRQQRRMIGELQQAVWQQAQEIQTYKEVVRSFRELLDEHGIWYPQV